MSKAENDDIYMTDDELSKMTPVMFEDEEDVDRINSLYKELRDMGDGPLTGEKIKAYDDLYSSLYQYIRRVNPLWEAGADRMDIWAKLQDEYHMVYTLSSENADPFAGLCSRDEFALIGKENVHAFGCVKRIEGEDRACGIIIFEIHPEDENRSETVAEIKWLYVDENCRGMHAGDCLMTAMYHSLNRAGIKAVSTDIPMRDILPVTVGDFLSGWWIYFKAEPRMKICLPLSRIMDSVSDIG
ncbi:MAG: GNAT family N-acetyltransferase [Lachnospiraceae bacterium]|nr:GNAT family N-acetyltransferase [Lachnospiraceae bacterium]